MQTGIERARLRRALWPGALDLASHPLRDRAAALSAKNQAIRKKALLELRSAESTSEVAGHADESRQSYVETYGQ